MKTVQDSKFVEYPVCDMRAESEGKQSYKITDYDLLISNTHIGNNEPIYNDNNELNEYQIRFAKNNVYDYDIYVYLESKLNKRSIIAPLSKDMIKHLVDKHNITDIEDIINIDVSFKVYSGKEIIFNDEYIVPVDIPNNYITVTKNNKNNYINDYLTEFVSDCVSDKKNFIHNYNICGESIISDINTVEDNNRYVSTLKIENLNTQYTHKFKIEYPLLYDDENKIIEFINTYGSGSVEGLKCETIYVDIADNYNKNEIVA